MAPLSYKLGNKKMTERKAVMLLLRKSLKSCVFQWWFKFSQSASTNFVLRSKSDLRSSRLFRVCLYLCKTSVLYSTVAISPYLGISVNVYFASFWISFFVISDILWSLP